MKRLALYLFSACALAASQPYQELRAPDEVAARAMAQEIAASAPWRAFTAKLEATGSMIPAMDEGCIVVWGLKPWHLLKAGHHGDVVLYRRPIFSATHRLRKRTATGYQAQGDNNLTPDLDPVEECHYVGAVLAVIRFKPVSRRAAITLVQLNR